MTKIDCTKLEKHLKNKEWQKADKETIQLMLEAGGRKDDGFFDYEGINRVSRKNFWAIDNLWTEHSNGKFGFSVQEQILKDVREELKPEARQQAAQWAEDRKILSENQMYLTSKIRADGLMISELKGLWRRIGRLVGTKREKVMWGLFGETKEEIWATEAQVFQKLEKVDNELISLPKGYLPNFRVAFEYSVPNFESKDAGGRAILHYIGSMLERTYYLESMKATSMVLDWLVNNRQKYRD